MKKDKITYYVNGNIKTLTKYFTDDFYYQKEYDFNGNEIIEIFIWKNQIHGRKIYYKENKQCIYVNGVEVYNRYNDLEIITRKKQIIYKVKGNVVYLFEKKGGSWSISDFSAKFKNKIDRSATDIIKSNKMTGTYIFYYDSGEKQEEYEYKKGVLKSVHLFHKNGQIKTEYFYHGREILNNGDYLIYDEKGNDVGRFTILNGTYNGIRINKTKEEEISGIYKDGYMVSGEEKHYKDGLLTYHVIYKDGEKEYEEDTYKNETSKDYYKKSIVINEIYKDGKLISKKYFHKNGKRYCGANSEIKFEKHPELKLTICKNCFHKDYEEIFDLGFNICKHDFFDLKNKCPYYLEHLSYLREGQDLGVLE